MKGMWKKTVSLTMVFGMCLAMLTGCGSASPGSGNEERTVRICSTTVYVSSPQLIMEKKGFLEKRLPENVKVEWSKLVTGPDIRDALLSDNVDIADFSLMTFITGRESNLPIQLVSFSAGTPISLYSHDKGISKLSDFQNGDTISITNKNTNLHIAFLALCKKELGNATALDNNLTAIPAADALSSLQTSDDFSGGIFSFPMSSKADQVDSLTKIYDMTDLIKEYNIGSAVVARQSFYNDNPDIMKAFLEAQQESIDFITGHPEEAAEILAEIFGCEKEAVVKTIELMPPVSKITGYDKQAQLLYETGILQKEPQKFSELDNYDKIAK